MFQIEYNSIFPRVGVALNAIGPEWGKWIKAVKDGII